MGHFPFFMEIGGKKGMVVGGGRVAARKVEKLLPFGPVLTVIAATDEEALNGRIAEYCQAARIPVNVVDDREKCTFFFPALVKEGALTVGISTDGKSPAAASWLRGKIAGMLPDGLGDTIDLLGQIRPMVMERVTQESDRKRILEKLFLYCLEKEGKAALEELAALLAEEIFRQDSYSGTEKNSGRQGDGECDE